MGSHMLTIHGHKVYCDSDHEYHGLKYLMYDLDEDSVKELFAQVEHDREVPFEDKEHRKFALVDGENGSFTVVSHGHASGWF